MILQLVQENVVQDTVLERYFFQTFSKGSQFQVPGTYLELDSEKQMKKTFSNSTKLLIRYNKEREMTPLNQLVLFLRLWNQQEQTYQGHIEFALPEKFRKISKKTLEAFKAQV